MIYSKVFITCVIYLTVAQCSCVKFCKLVAVAMYPTHGLGAANTCPWKWHVLLYSKLTELWFYNWKTSPVLLHLHSLQRIHFKMHTEVSVYQASLRVKYSFYFYLNAWSSSFQLFSDYSLPPVVNKYIEDLFASAPDAFFSNSFRSHGKRPKQRKVVSKEHSLSLIRTLVCITCARDTICKVLLRMSLSYSQLLKYFRKRLCSSILAQYKPQYCPYIWSPSPRKLDRAFKPKAELWHGSTVLHFFPARFRRNIKLQCTQAYLTWFQRTSSSFWMAFI